MVKELERALGSADPAMLRGIAEYYCWLHQAKATWDQLEGVFERLETDLVAVLETHRFAFRRFSSTKPEVSGHEPHDVLMKPAAEMLASVRIERAARAKALTEARGYEDKPNRLLARAEADLPFVGKPAIAAYFAFTAAVEWRLDPAHMAMVESLIASGYFDGLRVEGLGKLYGTDLAKSEQATDRWRNALKSLGFTAAELKAARARARRKRR